MVNVGKYTIHGWYGKKSATLTHRNEFFAWKLGGQFILATSHDRKTRQMVVNCKGNGTPAISGKSRLVKYYNLARLMHCYIV